MKISQDVVFFPSIMFEEFNLKNRDKCKDLYNIAHQEARNYERARPSLGSNRGRREFR